MNILNNYNDNKKDFIYNNDQDIEEHRRDLIKKLSDNNFDKKNNESLRNVNLKKFFEFKYKYNLPEDPSFTKKNKDGSYSILLIDGQCEKYSDQNIELSNIGSDESKEYFNNQLTDENDFFIHLNSLFLNCGFKILIKEKKTIKIKISNIISDENLTVFQRNYFICEKGAKVDLIEEYENKNDAINNVYHVLNLGEKVDFNHTIIQDNTINHNLILSTFATCNKKSFYKQRVYNFSDGYVRNFHFSDLKQSHSEVDLQGFFFLKGNNSSNNKTFVSHLAEDCKSNQVYKGILNEKSNATYFSNTYVDSKAQKTEGYQLSKGILLSEDASYFSKPELKIYADDVKCSHGSTIGPIDVNAIFYLRSRGMSKNAATKMLVSSFINEDLNSIKDDNVSEIIEKKLIRYLSQVK